MWRTINKFAEAIETNGMWASVFKEGRIYIASYGFGDTPVIVGNGCFDSDNFKTKKLAKEWCSRKINLQIEA